MSNIPLLFSLWRTYWCSYVSFLSFINIIKKKYNNSLQLLLYVIIFMVIDILLIIKNKNIYNKQIIIHHIIVILLLLIGIYIVLYTNKPHHNVISMCISTEVVTSIHIVNYLSVKYKNIFYYRLYRILYIFLTLFWRGNIWRTIISNALNNNNSNIICIYGITPFIVFDMLWIKKCIFGLLYKFKY